MAGQQGKNAPPSAGKGGKEVPAPRSTGKNAPPSHCGGKKVK